MFTVYSYLEQQNELGDDNLYTVEIDGVIWFCVADGAGGTGSGYRASSYIIDAFKKLTLRDDVNNADDFESFLRAIDLELASEGFGGESTAVLGTVEDGVALGASVGDSEAWLFNYEYEYSLTSLQHAKPLLGSGKSIPIGFGPVEVEQFLLVGSDGLFKYSGYKDIRAQLSKGAFAVEIAALAKKETSRLQDDISVIIISKSFMVS